MTCATTLLALAAPVCGWEQEKAFGYLEARQQDWANWKPAQKAGGPCISCHTGLSYMLARRAMGETEPRPQEKIMAAGVKSRVLANPPQTMLLDPGAEAILNLLTLSFQRRNGKEPVAEADRLAIERLWAIQIREGAERGAWSWFMNDLHPVESEHSVFYAATLAELALSAYPAGEGSKTGMAALHEFLKREAPRQPLHNRLAWIAFSESSKAAKPAVWKELWAAQGEDGGWTTAALGPWSARETAPADAGSNAYATAWAAYAARQSGVACTETGLKRALAWLEKRQDGATGAFLAVSMNKMYPQGSMQSKFMTDAATGFAAAALGSCAKQRPR